MIWCELEHVDLNTEKLKSRDGRLGKKIGKALGIKTIILCAFYPKPLKTPITRNPRRERQKESNNNDNNKNIKLHYLQRVLQLSIHGCVFLLNMFNWKFGYHFEVALFEVAKSLWMGTRESDKSESILNQ